MFAVVVVSLVAPALLLLAAARARSEQKRLPQLRAQPLQTPLLVVIPARNEEHRLPATLDALLKEPSPHMRVVIVDDRSTDGTAALVVGRAATDPRLTLLKLDDDPPPGAFGKPRALHAAIEKASEDVVMVVDADVVVAAGFVGGFVAAFTERAVAAATALPRLDNVTVAEEALVPAFVAAVGAVYAPSHINDNKRPFLNGQLMVFNKKALDDVGGFDAVKDTVLEDVAIARRLHEKQYKLAVFDGRALAQTRMYTSVGEVVRGFGKNARPLYGARLVPLALLLLATSWLPWICLACALTTDGAADDAAAAAGLVVAVVVACSNRVVVGSRWWLGLFSPLVQGVVAGVFLTAAVVRRGSWRGRTFTT